MTPIHGAAKAAAEIFERSRDELLPTLEAVIATHDDANLRELRTKLMGLKNHHSRREMVQGIMPKGFITCDSRAASEGMRAPPHIAFHATIVEEMS